MKCAAVLDGVGKIRVGDAIWPVADLVVALLVSAVTLGAGSGLSASMMLAAQTATGSVSAGMMQLMETSKWH